MKLRILSRWFGTASPTNKARLGRGRYRPLLEILDLVTWVAIIRIRKIRILGNNFLGLSSTAALGCWGSAWRVNR